MGLINLLIRWHNLLSKLKSKILSKKLIGVVASNYYFSTTTDRYGLNSAYYRFLKKFGSVVIIPATDDYIHKNLDLLVLPGGADVLSTRYGQKPDVLCGKSDIHLEYFDTYILPQYIENRTPIFGICRGFQGISVTFGASLIQHVDNEYSVPRSKLVDKILLVKSDLQPEGLPDYFYTGKAKGASKKMVDINYQVNSIHHQVVDHNNLGDRVEVLAFNKIYKTVEAIGIKGYPALGVQYHPKSLGL